MRTETRPFGDNKEHLGVVGAVGMDVHARSQEKLPYPSGRKVPVTFEELTKIQDRFNLEPEETFPALTALNFALGYQKLNGSSSEGQVVLHTPLAERDPSSEKLKNTIYEGGVLLSNTPYEGINPQSLIVRQNGDKIVFTAKPEETPPITDFDPRVDAMALASKGNWKETFHNVVDFTENRIPRILIGSESQIKQLSDPEKKEAYFRALKGAGGILCNDDEAALLVTAAGQQPDSNPVHLARQLQHVGEGLPIVSMSRGPDGAVLLAGEDIHLLAVPQVNVINTVGAGDQYAAVIAHGIRNNGDSADNIRTTMINAARAAAGVVQVKDSLSGQMGKEGLLKNYTTNNGFRHEHHTPRDLQIAATIIDLRQKA